MALKYHEREGKGAYVTTEACPLCGSNFEGGRSLADHIQNTCPETGL